jgi:hypothetical protein
MKSDTDCTYQLPQRLLHCNVYASVIALHRPGYLPHEHIVVLHNPDKPEDRAYSTHPVMWQEGWRGPDGSWVMGQGHYDLDRATAIADMAERAGAIGAMARRVARELTSREWGRRPSAEDTRAAGHLRATYSEQPRRGAAR